jgi:hypothetical protein
MNDNKMFVIPKPLEMAALEKLLIDFGFAGDEEVAAGDKLAESVIPLAKPALQVPAFGTSAV